MHTYSILCLITLHLLKHFDIAHLIDTGLQLDIGVPSLSQIEVIWCLRHAIAHRKDLSDFLEVTLIVMLVSARRENLVELRAADAVVSHFFTLVCMLIALFIIVHSVFQIVVNTLLRSHLTLILVLVNEKHLVLGRKRRTTFVKMRPLGRVPDPRHHIGIDWLDELARSDVTLMTCSPIIPVRDAAHLLIVLANHIVLVALPRIIVPSLQLRPRICIPALLHCHGKLQLLLTILGAHARVKHLAKHAHGCQPLVG